VYVLFDDRDKIDFEWSVRSRLTDMTRRRGIVGLVELARFVGVELLSYGLGQRDASRIGACVHR